MRFTLDSNILVYIHDHGDKRREIALSIIDRSGHADCILTLQSLGEFFRVATARLRLPVPTATAALRVWRDIFPIHSAGESTLDAAVDAVARYRLSFWDAMLWAAAREAGCGAILSEDMQDGQVIGGVRIVNPFDPANAGQIERLFA
jgi:predicted nucleic acid-binding protein